MHFAQRTQNDLAYSFRLVESSPKGCSRAKESTTGDPCFITLVTKCDTLKSFLVEPIVPLAKNGSNLIIHNCSTSVMHVTGVEFAMPHISAQAWSHSGTTTEIKFSQLLLKTSQSKPKAFKDELNSRIKSSLTSFRE